MELEDYQRDDVFHGVTESGNSRVTLEVERVETKREKVGTLVIEHKLIGTTSTGTPAVIERVSGGRVRLRYLTTGATLNLRR